MEAYDEETGESSMYKTGELKEQPRDTETKMAELIDIKEELHRAKDNAMQSWLDSKPLIDELEKLQANLASARNRTSMSNIVISELKSQLEAISIEIRTKMEEETNPEDERQSLRTLQLTLQAISLESDAFGASAVEALAHVKSSETDNTIVRISQEEYHALTRKAKEETALAEWRVSVSMEQKLAAEESRNFALSRLKELRRKKRNKEEKIINEEEVEEQQSPVKVMNSGIDFPKARAQAIGKSKQRKPQQQRRKSVMKSKKKKLSIFNRIRSFLVRSIARLFR
ncbi:hypothetical protein GH714_031955 [Hevea brasiliensis]|uniref:WEB family protein n=1 Tax=Hevea brasiliensis TaxID=3981 RepID=A0A6A6L521_HEVBR|nr:hypothetical protein GH714_031955 [Hevea brasiliensis]